jgi:hypothetical protein
MRIRICFKVSLHSENLTELEQSYFPSRKALARAPPSRSNIIKFIIRIKLMILFSFIFLDINYYLLTESKLQFPRSVSFFVFLSPSSSTTSSRLLRSINSGEEGRSPRLDMCAGEEKLVFISLGIASCHSDPPRSSHSK